MFYWISWSIWVTLTFLLKKENPSRFGLSAAILIVIILANTHFTLWEFEINSSGIFLIFYCYTALSGEKKKTISYFYLCSFIVTIAYVTFHLFELFDPVWLILKKEWMMGICLGYLAILLQKSLRGRLLIIISGTLQGEILYTYILNKYGFPYQISSFAYLDACSLTAALLLGWSFIEYVGSYYDSHFKIMEREKQKSS
jgi:hypothetical protein